MFNNFLKAVGLKKLVKDDDEIDISQDFKETNESQIEKLDHYPHEGMRRRAEAHTF